MQKTRLSRQWQRRQLAERWQLQSFAFLKHFDRLNYGQCFGVLFFNQLSNLTETRQPVEKRRTLGKSDKRFRLANLEFFAHEYRVRTNSSDDGSLGLLIAEQEPRNRAFAKRTH